MINSTLLHYGSAALALGLTSIGGGIGHGYAGYAVLQASQRQPASTTAHFRSLIIGLALIESGIIIAFVTTLMIVFGSSGVSLSLGEALAELGIALAIGVSGAAMSIASSFVVKGAAESIARQPLFSQKIITFMVLTQSIIEAPVILAFIISLMIRSSIYEGMTIAHGLQALAAGLAVALGSIGPSIGLALFSYAACVAIGLNTQSYQKVFPFTLINEAFIETPMILSLLIGMIILFHPIAPDAVHNAYILLAAAISIGVSAIGTAAGIGYSSSKSVIQLCLNGKDVSSAIFKATFFVATIIETSVIYGMFVAILLIRGAV